MDLRIVQKFNKPALAQYIQNALDQQRLSIEARLTAAGEIFIEMAQANATFLNHTFDLRSSIGYGIVKDGVLIKVVFNVVSTGDDGAVKGREVLAQAVAEMKLGKGYALIGVAGMGYAAAVESKNRDVITNTSRHISDMLEAALGKAA